MAGVLVDANVLLDILTADPRWLAWSSAELRRARSDGPIFVNPIICAEVAPAFDFDWPRIEAWLAQAGFGKEPLPFDASPVAAAAHREYRRRGGARDTALPDHTPSLPGTDPRSDRFRCGGRESKFLAVN